MQTAPDARDLREPTRLFNRAFILPLQGQAVSRLGSQLAFVAVALWLKQAADSATVYGLVQMLASLPAALLAPLGRVSTGLRPQRRVLLLADAVHAAASLSLAALALLPPDAAPLTLGWLLVALIAAGTAGALFEPAFSATLPDLVPDGSLTRANALRQLALQLSAVSGQGLGGLLFRLLGGPVLFIVNGLAHALAAASHLCARPSPAHAQTGSGWGQHLRAARSDLRVGYRYVRQRRGLRRLILGAASLTFFSVPVITLLPFYIDDVLGGAPDWYGFTLAAFGVGSLAGFLAATSIRLSGRARRRGLLALMLLQASAYGLLGLVRDPLLAMATALGGGAASGLVAVNIASILRLATPAPVRGPVLGLLTTLTATLASLSMGAAGAAADLAGGDVSLVYLACGAALALLALLVALSPDVRAFAALADAGPRPTGHEERVAPLLGQPIPGQSPLSEGAREHLSTGTLSHLLIAGTLGLVLGAIAIVLSPLWALVAMALLLVVVFLVGTS